jgi:predicted dinucleotide-binding enzyme
MKVAIIGKGNVGTALAAGLKRAGHEIRFGHRDQAEPVLSAAKWGDVIVLAVLFSAVRKVAKEIESAADGKPLVDVTNALGPADELALGFSTSAAEELQGLLPRARVAKAFNAVFAGNQSTGTIGKERLSAFVAADASKAKQVTMQLAHDIGFDPVDYGSLRSARYVEPMAKLIIELGYDLKMGTRIGFKLVKA